MKTIHQQLFSLIVISLVIFASCKEDTVRPDPLAIPEEMTMTISINGVQQSPILFDNYITLTTRQDSIKGKYFVINSLLTNEVEKVEIAITNWLFQGGHPSGVFPKQYLFSASDTARKCQSIGHPDSLYCDGAVIRYYLSNDYIYQSQDESFGHVTITRCDPIRFKINGNFNAMLVALPPYEDSVHVSGSFENQYYKRRGY